MKDYKLSEIKEICGQYALCKSTCIFHDEDKGCIIRKLLAKEYPSDWDLDVGENENKARFKIGDTIYKVLTTFRVVTEWKIISIMKINDKIVYVLRLPGSMSCEVCLEMDIDLGIYYSSKEGAEQKVKELPCPWIGGKDG